MANPWFKMHADFYHDPKVQTMSEAMQRRLLMLFCLRCSDELDRLTDEEIQCALRISARQWLATKALFVEKGFIDEDLNVLNWNKRQHIDDDGLTPEDRRKEQSRERTRQWRERHKDSNGEAMVTQRDAACDVTVTSPKRHVTLPETDTETDTETEGTDNAFGPSPNAAHANVTVTSHVTQPVTQPVTQEPSHDKPPKAGRKKPDKGQVLTVDDVVAEGAARQYAQDWMTARRAKGVGLTRSELEANKREATSAGISFAQAVQVCAENGWRGFKASYYANLQNRNSFALARASAPSHTPGAPIALVRGDTMQSADLARELLFPPQAAPEHGEKNHATG